VKMLARLSLLLCVVAVLGAQTSATAALSNAHYRCGITPRIGGGVPWTGNLTLSISADGIVNGSYRSASIRPDPFHGKTMVVTGGSTGNSIHFAFGMSGRPSVQAHFHGRDIVGTMFSSTRMYDFVAQRVK